MKLTEFDLWVGAHRIPDKFGYSKGWWDYVELVQRLSYKFGIEDVEVIGRYVVETPPPEART